MTLVESTAMTDNDDPAPPRGDSSSAGGTDESGDPGSRPAGENDGRARIRSAITRIAPTDPEVPSAKRRGVLRHQRSLVGLTAVVMGLLSITLALLYRASQQVGTRDEGIGPAARPSDTRSEREASSIEPIHQSTPPNTPSPAPSGSELDEAPSDGTSSDSAPAGSSAPPPKPPKPALDIIRTPAF